MLNIYLNYRKPKPERLKFDNIFIEFFPIILYPTLSFFISYIMWSTDECVDKNQINRILACNIGISCGLMISKPLEWIK
jgi:hypothetical protein